MHVMCDAYFEWLNIRHGLFIYFNNTDRLIEDLDKSRVLLPDGGNIEFSGRNCVSRHL